MKRLLLVLGLATILNACGGKDNAPGLAPVVITGGSTATGGRTHTGGTGTTTDTGTAKGGTGTSVGGTGTEVGGTGTSMGGVGTGVGGATSSGGSGANIGGRTGAGGTTDDSGVETDAGPLNEGPVVKITNPAVSLATPDDPGTIVDSSADVICTVQKSPAIGAADVNQSTIKIEMLDSKGTVVPNQPTSPASSTGNADEYKAKFTFSSAIVPAGRITFRCSASDQAPQPLTGSDTVATYVDYGPDITYISPPKDGTAYVAKTSVPFEIQVDPHPLDTKDNASAIATVSLQVYTAQIPLKLNDKGHYVAQANFGDLTTFPDGLSGTIASGVTATNLRKPKPGTAIKPINIVLDGEPPTITIDDTVLPLNAIIGNANNFCFTVDDNGGSGVNENTITVTLNTTTVYTYLQPLPTLWSHTKAGYYCFQIHVSDFPNSVEQVLVGVTVADNAGNVAKAVTRAYHLDNVPPFVSLDTPKVRVITHNNGATQCSIPFDPLGNKAASTGSTQTGSSGYVRFRAFVWERANAPAGVDVDWVSGVDDTSVHLYLRPWKGSSTSPVEVDADKDPLNLCDSVADDLKTNANSAQTQLGPVPLSASNGLDFTSSDYVTPPNVSAANCSASGSIPDPMCLKSSDLTYVANQPIAGATGYDLTAVYAFDVAGGLLCAGDQLDIADVCNIPDGWLCAVAEATDKAGHTGISAPIPICLDHTNGASPPACTSEDPPDCAVGCVPPSRGLRGDIDSNGKSLYLLDSNGDEVFYDTGNPAPFVIEFRSGGP